jgi:hypothetical protein
MSKRKIFYLHDDKNFPIMAGGVILYKIEKERAYLLMIEKQGTYEDLGGKTEDIDETIQDVVSRETCEESNNLLNNELIKKRLQTSKYMYNLNSKYIVYLVHANEEESKLKSEDFGDKEIHDDMPRKIKWIPADVLLNKNIFKHKLAHRLKHKYFLDMITNIEKNHSEWDVLN